MALGFAYGSDISIANPRSIAYITTDPTATDEADDDSAPIGSIRFVFKPGDADAHIEKKQAPRVWNDTGLRISSSSLAIGLDMTMSAIAGWLETRNPSAVTGHQRSFLPHTEFDDEQTLFTHAVKLKKPEPFVIFSTAVSEVQGTLAGGIYTIGINLGLTPSRTVETSVHEVGTLGASSKVTVKFFRGTDNTGFKFNEKNLPASDLLANQTLTIDYDEDLGFESGQNVFQEFTSTANFSLKIDSGGNPLTTHNGHETGELTVFTENFMLDEDLGLMFDLDLGPMFSIQFP